METFPRNVKKQDASNVEKQDNIISILYGNRFHKDQTLYEYLIEFLLVFVSAKGSDKHSGKMRFHKLEEGPESVYYANPRMGLRRFIFYEKSRKNSKVKADEYAYKKHQKILLDRMQDIDMEKAIKYIECIQDLLHGYAVVIKKRSWMAQAIMPVCPELIFNDAAPSEAKRNSEVKWDINPITVDTKFDMTKHNFLARGGQLYYLHLLQGLQKESKDKKEKLESLLRNMLTAHSSKLSTIATFIQEAWEEDMGFANDDLLQKLSLDYIPERAYVNCEKNAIDELLNFLSAENKG